MVCLNGEAAKDIKQSNEAAEGLFYHAEYSVQVGGDWQ